MIRYGFLQCVMDAGILIYLSKPLNVMNRDLIHPFTPTPCIMFWTNMVHVVDDIILTPSLRWNHYTGPFSHF